MMASYFHDLSMTGKERYKAKLEVVGLTVKDDPYMPCNAARFCTKMSLWPKIEYGHIFAYSLQTRQVYTQEQLPT